MAKIKNPVTIVQQSSSGGDNKLPAFIDGSLTTITAEDLSGATSIRDFAFYGSSITGITIPSSVISIGNNAFSSCSSLTEVTIGNSVTSIGREAFTNCSRLTSITIPDSVTSIGSSTFSSCSSLTSITIPDSVTSIGSSAFYNCSSLTSITIPDSVTSIGSQAFWYCRDLTSVTYQGQVPNIQSNTFASCTSITKYDFRNCTTIPTLSNINSLGHASGCQIVLPDALYDTWTTSYVWSSLTRVTFVKASEYVE